MCAVRRSFAVDRRVIDPVDERWWQLCDGLGLVGGCGAEKNIGTTNFPVIVAFIMIRAVNRY